MNKKKKIMRGLLIDTLYIDHTYKINERRLSLSVFQLGFIVCLPWFSTLLRILIV